MHDIIPKYDLFDRFERAAGKWEFSIFMEPTELLQAAATLGKNHAGYGHESRNISISTDQSAERKIDYSTWRQHAESENPARRLAFCNKINEFIHTERQQLKTFAESQTSLRKMVMNRRNCSLFWNPFCAIDQVIYHIILLQSYTQMFRNNSGCLWSSCWLCTFSQTWIIEWNWTHSSPGKVTLLWTGNRWNLFQSSCYII